MRFWVFVGIVAVALVGVFTFSSSLAHPGFRASKFDLRCRPEDSSLRTYGSEFVGPDDDDARNWEVVRDMVARTKGFYAKDFPLQLGWNNIRYMIEASLLHASLLNRTLVVPSFIYARSCIYDFDVCSSFGQRFRRSEDIGLGDFAFLPDDEQIAWRLPISLMIDWQRLRAQHPVITVAEYLQLHHLDPALESGNGWWNEVEYHRGPFHPTLRFLEQPDWDNDIIRVDKMPIHVKPMADDDKVGQALRERGRRLTVGDAENLMSQHGVHWRDEADFERLLNRHGYARLSSFRGSFVEMFKAVTEWEDEVGDVSIMKGLVDQFANETADVIHVQGETHWNRKAGQLLFTSHISRERFAGMVLHGVHPIPPVRALGDRLARRMADINDGRQYLAAHMRRGDFAVLGWTEPTILDHINRILNRLSIGMDRLQEYSSAPPQVVPVPGVKPDTFFAANPGPRREDKYFLATDVRNVTELAILREQGAVMLDDLLRPEDLRILGWPAVFGDVRAQVEQEVATHAAFFYGHSMSSVAGGVANLRAARGQDPRTCFVD